LWVAGIGKREERRGFEGGEGRGRDWGHTELLYGDAAAVEEK
jgi:hypothetical protein